MKNKLNLLRFVIIFLALPFSIISCENKSDVINERKSLVLEPPPSVTVVSPQSGLPGSVVTITGTGFGTDKSKVNVRFNTTNATNIIAVTDTKIEVEAPQGFSNQTVRVEVQVSGLTSGSKAFIYIDTTPLLITQVSDVCFTGSTVVISGNNFSLNKEENIVKFGNVEATVTAATKTLLTVVTPNLGTVASADITVTRFGVASNTLAIAVDADQNKVATYNWATHTAKPGLVHKTGEFTLFGSTIKRINIIDVTLDAANTLGIGFNTTNKSTVAMCNDYGAVAGINAGYFPVSGSTDKDPYIRINGTKVQDGHTGVSVHFTNAALLIHNNVASVRRLGMSGSSLNLLAAAIPVTEAENVIVCGPMLIADGVIDIVSPTNSHNTSITARTGLGVSADGKHVYLVTVDTGNGSTGVSTPQLAKILQALGAFNAMNFDGGGSTTMFLKDRGTGGLVNVPSGGVQRSVRSVIYVK
ncbi:MAG: hypothetical protein BGN92_00985 [Sphingobacteriales bacterium 41-5]|nr:MAG: hypothetical protein BGN92_00985 [Sphingobacteriales bacterium 41-5]